MNILVIVAILLALTGFKTAGGNGDNGQATQGFYDPLMRGWTKKKMNNNHLISNEASWNVEGDTYFRMLNSHTGADEVFYKYPESYGYGSKASTNVELYNPIRYTTENLT